MYEGDRIKYRRYPKAPPERRIYAFIVDFLVVWFLSTLVSGIWSFLVFIFAWLVLRVLLIQNNHGQSLGKWAFDLKVVDPLYNRIPGLVPLAKREGIVGFFVYLAMIGISINFSNGISLLILMSPILTDGGLALMDEEYRQALHDRVAATMVVQTRRGFSLDLRLRQIAAQVKKNMKR